MIITRKVDEQLREKINAAKEVFIRKDERYHTASDQEKQYADTVAISPNGAFLILTLTEPAVPSH